MTKSVLNPENLAFRHSPEATLILQNRIILRANLMAQQLFGYGEKELLQTSIRKLYLAPHDYEIIGEKAYGLLQTNATYSDHRFMRHASGAALWVHGKGRALSMQDPTELSVWCYRLVEEAPIGPCNLTGAEIRVARYLVQGFKNKEIAASIGCSPRTVEAHRAAMIRKFGVRNSGELLRELLKGTYITPQG